jgi:hypothetical protein
MLWTARGSETALFLQWSLCSSISTASKLHGSCLFANQYQLQVGEKVVGVTTQVSEVLSSSVVPTSILGDHSGDGVILHVLNPHNV